MLPLNVYGTVLWYDCETVLFLASVLSWKASRRMRPTCCVCLFFLIVMGVVKSNWFHLALRPLVGLLCQPHVIMMMMKLVEWLAGETEVLRKIVLQCRFVHHKPHMPARTRTRAAAVGSQRLTAWATALPVCLFWFDAASKSKPCSVQNPLTLRKHLPKNERITTDLKRFTPLGAVSSYDSLFCNIRHVGT
jgi:hypothetical protein